VLTVYLYSADYNTTLSQGKTFVVLLKEINIE
jgi:hypothetical protein